MHDVAILVLVLFFVSSVALAYRVRSSYVAGLFVIFYWSFWLVPLYLTDEGYNKPNLYALGLIFSFLVGYTVFFSISFGPLSRSHRRPLNVASDYQRRHGRMNLHPLFLGRIYTAHLLLICGTALLLAVWTFPYLGSFFAGHLERNIAFSNDAEINLIFNTPLKSFIYFRIINGLFPYFYIYCLLAAFFRKSAIPVVIMLVFALFFSASTLSRSSLANLFLLVAVAGFLFSTVQYQNFLRQIGGFFAGRRLLYTISSLLVAGFGMVLISFNRIGGLSLIGAYHYLIDAIAGYGVLGYASLATDLQQSYTPLQTHLSFGSSFFEGLTQPFASFGRRVFGDEFYYLLQRYEMTANYRNAFNLVGVGFSRELTANVHYSSIYAAYVDARFIGPVFFGSLWGFFAGRFCRQWCHYGCPISLGLASLLIYHACMACHVHPAERESFWFPIVILMAAKWYFGRRMRHLI